MAFKDLFVKWRAPRQEAEPQPVEGDRELPPVEGGNRLLPVGVAIGLGLSLVVILGVMTMLPSAPLREQASPQDLARKTQPQRQYQPPPVARVVPPEAPPPPPAPKPPAPDLNLAQRFAVPDIDPRVFAGFNPAGPAVMGGAGPAIANPPPDPLKDRKESPTVIFGGGQMGMGSVQTVAQPAAIAGMPQQFQQQQGASKDGLQQRLEPIRTPGTMATRLADRRYMITKGDQLPCTLQSAINTEQPNIVVCTLTRDAYGADRSTILLDRGSKLVGEYSQGAQVGQRRLFVLWTRAETPTGVLVQLDSPTSDSLGRGGIGGNVDTRFFERFGAAAMISIISNLSLQLTNRSASTSGPTVVLPGVAGAGRDSANAILEQTAKLPPIITLPQGAAINITVARDLDFRGVYGLEPAQ